MRALDAAVWPCDWWDNSRIFADTTNSDFVLFDVQKGSISRLFTRGQLATFMEEMKISAPSGPHAFAIWNGHENDFYLTDTHQKWLAQESFLIKVERPGGKLKLISPHFKFEWSDHLDPTGRFYLYSGREPGKASDGIFLRDLETGTDRVLVRPTTNEYFSIPRFYRDSVIYVRSNALWQISLDRTNNVRLFPPIEAEEPKSH
jgi:hypothetical protein